MAKINGCCWTIAKTVLVVSSVSMLFFMKRISLARRDFWQEPEGATRRLRSSSCGNTRIYAHLHSGVTVWRTRISRYAISRFDGVIKTQSLDQFLFAVTDCIERHHYGYVQCTRLLSQCNANLWHFCLNLGNIFGMHLTSAKLPQYLYLDKVYLEIGFDGAERDRREFIKSIEDIIHTI